MRNFLIILVGPRAIGKTFYINRLVEAFPGQLRRVKTVTSRPPRSDEPTDDDSYHFVTDEQFRGMISDGIFVEYTVYGGHYYGSSFNETSRALTQSHAIMALTPDGARVWWEHRNKINLAVTLFRPMTEEVLRLNLLRRGIDDPEQLKHYVEEAKEFKLPPSMSLTLVPISGETYIDEPKILDCFRFLSKS